MKQILIKLNACQEAIEWVQDKTIQQAVNDCQRGDWMLWLANKVDVDFKKLTLAKGLCANTVRHLMKDERSIKAVDTAIAFGEGKATLDELQKSSDAAYAAYAAYADAAYAAAYADAAAAYAAAYAAYAAAYAAYAAAYAAYAAADAAYAAADAAAYAAAYAAAAAAAKKENQLQTANICREVIGKELIDKLEQL